MGYAAKYRHTVLRRFKFRNSIHFSSYVTILFKISFFTVKVKPWKLITLYTWRYFKLGWVHLCSLKMKSGACTCLWNVALYFENVSANFLNFGCVKFVMTVSRLSSKYIKGHSECGWILKLLSPWHNFLNEWQQVQLSMASVAFFWQWIRQTMTDKIPLSYSYSKQCLM